MEDVLIIAQITILLVLFLPDFLVKLMKERVLVENDTHTFRYSRLYRQAALILPMLILALILEGLSHGAFQPGRDKDIAYAVGSVVFGLAVLIYFHMRTYQVMLSPAGIEKKSWFKKQSIAWDDVLSIGEVKHWDSYRIRSQQGSFRLTKMLEGNATLRETLGNYLDEDRLLFKTKGIVPEHILRKRLKRFYLMLSLGLLLLTAAAIVMANQESTAVKLKDLKVYTSPDGTFSVLFPKEPRKQVKTLASQSEMTSYDVMTKGNTFGVVLSAYPDEVQKNADEQQLVDSVYKGISEKPGVKLIHSSRITLDGMAGREYRFQINDGKHFLIDRVYAIGGKMVQVMVEMKHGQEEEDIAKHFLDSFKLLQ